MAEAPSHLVGRRFFHVGDGALILGLTAAFAVACDPGSLLGPNALQGIDRIALRGPTCPVETQDDPCDELPHQAWIQVMDGRTRK